MCYFRALTLASLRRKGFESHFHREAEERSSLLQLIHRTLEFEIWGRDGRREIVVLFRSR